MRFINKLLVIIGLLVVYLAAMALCGVTLGNRWMHFPGDFAAGILITHIAERIIGPKR